MSMLWAPSYLSRAGLNDKSQLCRQIEKYADIYTSRVSNFLTYTPFMYFRAPATSLAHDLGSLDEASGATFPRGRGGEEEEAGSGGSGDSGDGNGAGGNGAVSDGRAAVAL
ncbi:hypothetical protein FOA52_005021 [Chlamydomonas sp. UWO 241]|nr:hypothetical protein FOA52_005021 [Chlamydomonas sp. UWO 241]